MVPNNPGADLNAVRVFVRVAEAGSFTGAARALAVPKSTVSAKVAGLEAHLGAALLYRTTRRMRLTETGADFFRSAARALSDLEAAESAASADQGALAGRLRVAAPSALGVHVLPPLLRAFLGRHPGIELDLVLDNRFVDLLAEGVDVAIRSGELRDSGLTSRRLGTTCFALVAAPSYLAKAGTPAHPDEVKGHARISFAAFGDTWHLSRGKQRCSIPVGAAIRCNDLAGLTALARQGLGIALSPSFVASDALARRALVHVLPEWRAHVVPLHIVAPAHRYRHARVRAFVDEISRELRELFDA
jgi:DNA-binding transcriptional LysR family regulator